MGTIIKYQEDGINRIYRKLFEDETEKHSYLLADEVGLGKTIVAAGVIRKLIEERKNSEGVKIAYISSNLALGKENIEKLVRYIDETGGEEIGEKDIDLKKRERLSLKFLEDFSENSSKKCSIYLITPATTITVDSPGTKVEHLTVYELMMPKEIVDKLKISKYNEKIVGELNKLEQIVYKGKIDGFQTEFWEDKFEKFRVKYNEKMEQKWEKQEKEKALKKFIVEVIDWDNLEAENKLKEAYKILYKIVSENESAFPQLKKDKIEQKIGFCDEIDEKDIETSKKAIEGMNQTQHLYYLRTIIINRDETLRGIINEINDTQTLEESWKEKIIKEMEAYIKNENRSAIEYDPYIKNRKKSRIELGKRIESGFKLLCKEYMKVARKCMIEMSIEQMEMDLFIADEMQNYSSIFNREGNLKDSEAKYVIDRILNREKDKKGKVLLMSATPFKYCSKSATFEEKNKEAFADSAENDDTENGLSLEMKGDEKGIYEEFKKIISFLNTESEEDKWFEKWEEINRDKRDLVNDIDENSVGNRSESYVKKIEEQSKMMKQINISRVERYMSGVEDIFKTKEEKVPCDQWLFKELENIPVKKSRDGKNIPGSLRYIKSTPAVMSFREEYCELNNLEDKNDANILKLRKLNEFLPIFAEENGEKLIYNARMRQLYKKIFDDEKQHKLLFIPPTRSDVTLKGIYKDKRGVSKRLFFSYNRLTVKSLAVLITYEAKRRIIKEMREIFKDKEETKILLCKKDDEEIREEFYTKISDLYPESAKKVDLNAMIAMSEKLYKCDEKKKGTIYKWTNKKYGDRKDPSTCKLMREKIGCEYFQYMCSKHALRIILTCAYEDVQEKEVGSEPIYLYDKITEYGDNGNIEAVLDEYFAFPGSESNISMVLSDMEQYSVNVKVKTEENGLNNKKSGTKKCDTDFALGHYSGNKAATDQSAADTLVKKMKRFNSPFWPFQFISTSISNEGFDFHMYCRKIVHWTLEYNPVKFEQREGRINRYHGYANRLKLSLLMKLMEKKGISFLNWEQAYDDVRKHEEMEKYVESSKGLFPDYVVDIPGIFDEFDEKIKEKVKQYSLERECYYYPYSIESEKFSEVLKSVAHYRALLGQVEINNLEENFVRFMKQVKEKNGKIDKKKYFIDLYPSD